MESLEHIIADYKPFIYKLAKAYTSNYMDYEDLTQEIYYQIWQSLSSYRKEAKLSTWVYRVCLNTALSYQKKEVRRKKRAHEIQEHFHHLGQTNSNEKIKLEQKIKRLLECVNQLKPVEKSIMLLYLEELSYEEIAAVIGISSSNVGTKINRIKPKLLKCIKSKGYER